MADAYPLPQFVESPLDFNTALEYDSHPFTSPKVAMSMFLYIPYVDYYRWKREARFAPTLQVSVSMISITALKTVVL